jgi:hypothetical protein
LTCRRIYRQPSSCSSVSSSFVCRLTCNYTESNWFLWLWEHFDTENS